MDNPAPALQDLHDLMIPSSPPIFPLNAGMWMLLLSILLILVVIVIRVMRHHKTTAYRRMGVTLLEAAQSTRDIHQVLKRVAMVTYSRERCAALYGDDWHAFLDSSCPDSNFSRHSHLAVEDAPDEELRHMAKDWILHHQRDTH